jgi:hypothetical protein
MEMRRGLLPVHDRDNREGHKNSRTYRECEPASETRSPLRRVHQEVNGWIRKVRGIHSAYIVGCRDRACNAGFRIRFNGGCASNNWRFHSSNIINAELQVKWTCAKN